tara:strand:+ start:465 stop:650 length:186 start_codon:yes stop_codon:yes gene_type:complete
MSSSFDTENNQLEINNSQGKVKVSDLISRLNEEKKIEKKRNLALGVAAVSAVTVFGIILTI